MANDDDDLLDEEDTLRVRPPQQPGSDRSSSVWAAAAGEELDDLDDPWSPAAEDDMGDDSDDGEGYGSSRLGAGGKIDVGPATGPVSLPDWTDPPTGQVPRVVIGDDREGAAARAGSQPRWRGDSGDWSEGDFEEGMFDESERIGALDDSNAEGNPYSFEEDMPSGETVAIGDEEKAPPAEPAGVAPIRSRTREEETAVAPGGFGGRDMNLAVLVGGGFFLLAVFMFMFGGRVGPFMLSFGVVMVCAYELFTTFQRAGLRPAPLIGITACASMMITTYAKGIEGMPLVLSLAFGATMLWYMVGVTPARPLLGIGSTMIVVVWVGLLGSFSALLLHGTEVLRPVLFGAIICTVASDVGWVAWGQHVRPHAARSLREPEQDRRGNARRARRVDRDRDHRRHVLEGLGRRLPRIRSRCRRWGARPAR